MTEPSLEELIEHDIVFGVFAPGARLIEDRLMRRYGASRHSLRSAFTALESRHLVLREPNRGVEVVEMTPDVVDELYAVRMILETSAANATRLPLGPTEIRKLSDLCEAHADAYKRGDFHSVFKLNMLFHSHQFHLCGNGTLAQAIEDFARRVQSIRAVKYDDQAHMQNVIQQHREIVDALAEGDQERYVAAVRAHLPASAEHYRKIYNLRHGVSALKSA